MTRLMDTLRPLFTADCVRAVHLHLSACGALCGAWLCLPWRTYRPNAEEAVTGAAFLVFSLATGAAVVWGSRRAAKALAFAGGCFWGGFAWLTWQYRPYALAVPLFGLFCATSVAVYVAMHREDRRVNGEGRAA